jgi:hypothetical protein
MLGETATSRDPSWLLDSGLPVRQVCHPANVAPVRSQPTHAATAQHLDVGASTYYEVASGAG